MLKKLRKMLGDVNSLSAVSLRNLIDTRSKDTIRKWCLGYAEEGEDKMELLRGENTNGRENQMFWRRRNIYRLSRHRVKTCCVFE